MLVLSIGVAVQHAEGGGGRSSALPVIRACVCVGVGAPLTALHRTSVGRTGRQTDTNERRMNDDVLCRSSGLLNADSSEEELRVFYVLCS